MWVRHFCVDHDTLTVENNFDDIEISSHYKVRYNKLILFFLVGNFNFYFFSMKVISADGLKIKTVKTCLK